MNHYCIKGLGNCAHVGIMMSVSLNMHTVVLRSSDMNIQYLQSHLKKHFKTNLTPPHHPHCMYIS